MRLLGLQILANWLRARGDLRSAVALSRALLHVLLDRAVPPLASGAALQIDNVAGLFASIATDVGWPADQLAAWPRIEAGLRRLGLDATVVTLAVGRAELLRLDGQYERADRLVRRLSAAPLLPGDGATRHRLEGLRERFVRRPDDHPHGPVAGPPEPPPEGEAAAAAIAEALSRAASLPGARNPLGAVMGLFAVVSRFAACHELETLRAVLPPLQSLVAFCAARGFTDDERTARWLEVVFLRRLGAREEAAAGLRAIRDGVEAQRLRISDPHLRAAAGIALTHLYPVSVALLQDLRRPQEMFEALEEAKSRVLADLISAAQAPRLLDPSAPRPRVACRAAALLGELRAALAASSQRAHYLTFLTDDDCSYAVLADAEGGLHSWRAAPGRAALLDAAQELELLIRGDQAAFPRPRPGILSVPEEAARWPFDPLLERIAPLLAPLEALLGQGVLRRGDVLCIAPDGAGFGLPWAALPLAGAPLIDSLVPVLVPSARALLAAYDQSCLEDARGGGADVVQAPHGHEGAVAAEGFEREAALLAALVPTVVHRGPAASLRALERLDLRGGVLHFAAHGEFRPHAPLEESGLALPEPDGSLPAGEARLAECRLTGARAGRLALAGSHVTLRACVSGAVAEIAGREALGMAFGLWQAGAQSVLAGLWDLNLPSSAALTEAFYRGWLGEGRPRAAAYAAAMRGVRDAPDGAWTHPYHWAGLALWGWWD
ncbi:CHAT domain-containing protein [Siccirubricoccus phaeus]|uniref:CHAT domain-containing protein n=1 Tax=Siccirubricoccus phaeus TaxID=2595053 RepID=UPI0011F0E231|nr:CHAT domain-containing protein [Siccirubricoccus phaeus]